MNDDLTISTIFLTEHWEIKVTQNEGSVELDLMYLMGGNKTDDTLGALLSPKFAKELGQALENAGYAASPDDEDD